MSITRGMDKEVVHIYNRILLSDRKEWMLLIATTWIDLETVILSEWVSPPGFPVDGDSPGKNTGVSCHALLQGIFPTQGSNPGSQHCKWILYGLSHQRNPRILEWVAFPFSRGTPDPRINLGSPAFADRFFTSWATREALKRAEERVNEALLINRHKVSVKWDQSVVKIYCMTLYLYYIILYTFVTI